MRVHHLAGAEQRARAPCLRRRSARAPRAPARTPARTSAGPPARASRPQTPARPVRSDRRTSSPGRGSSRGCDRRRAGAAARAARSPRWARRETPASAGSRLRAASLEPGLHHLALVPLEKAQVDGDRLARGPVLLEVGVLREPRRQPADALREVQAPLGQARRVQVVRGREDAQTPEDVAVHPGRLPAQTDPPLCRIPSVAWWPRSARLGSSGKLAWSNRSRADCTRSAGVTVRLPAAKRSSGSTASRESSAATWAG